MANNNKSRISRVIIEVYVYMRYICVLLVIIEIFVYIYVIYVLY